MNNFKKFVAVLLGVVMACVFATSAFAADFSKADTAAKAKAEIKAFAASYGITTIDNTVNSLTADQLQTIYNNMDALKATAASANATIKGTTDVAVATKAANDAVATMNSLLPAGVSISAPDHRHQRFFQDRCLRLMSPLTTQRISLLSLLRLPTTTTDNNTNYQRRCQQCCQEQCCRFQRQDRFFRCEPHHRFFQRCHQGHRR